MCLSKQDAWVLNMPKVSQNVSDAQSFEYARICFDRVLNISWVLNMPEF